MKKTHGPRMELQMTVLAFFLDALKRKELNIKDD